MTSEVTPELFASVPDQDGRFGRFGGKFVAETLMSALADLEQLYEDRLAALLEMMRREEGG